MAINQREIEKKCQEFLEGLGVPGFIVFGWQKEPGEFGVVSSYHEIPPPVVVKGIAWALHHVTDQAF